jgi:glutaminyl-tRNA synthetase
VSARRAALARIRGRAAFDTALDATLDAPFGAPLDALGRGRVPAQPGAHIGALEPRLAGSLLAGAHRRAIGRARDGDAVLLGVQRAGERRAGEGGEQDRRQAAAKVHGTGSVGCGEWPAARFTPRRRTKPARRARFRRERAIAVPALRRAALDGYRALPFAMSTDPQTDKRNFLEQEVERDLAAGGSAEGAPRVRTRFPPEPNGYLHIGHAKAISVDFGVAARYGGECNLRFDDTNPAKEETEYVEAIQADIRWLGYAWDRLVFASDWFEEIYRFAEELVEKGRAYVCDLTAEETREYRGTVNEPGRNSPYRERSVAENLDLLRRMRADEFPDGARTLRAKIDMASPNMNLRDPVMYRIQHGHHHRTGDAWCIYPMYDWAHGQCDALEGITHSLCSLEFENHRPLYDWFLDHISAPHRPRQIEFARLALTYTLLSKRKLMRLVQEGHVEGWDDPRMPTLRGLRRRGYTPESIRALCETVGVTKANSTIGMHVLESALRDDLNRRAERRMAVLRPLKVVITNLVEPLEVDAVNNPEDAGAGSRKLALTREIWIEQDDFREDAPRKYFRLAPGKEVRLRYAFCITCDEVVKDAAGAVVELRCTYDPATGDGRTPDGRKVKGILHWVSAETALDAEVRLYDHLFAVEEPEVVPAGGDFLQQLNPTSLEVVRGAKLEAALADAPPGATVQFERLGYFSNDPKRARPGAPAFHRTVALRDSWAKIESRA